MTGLFYFLGVAIFVVAILASIGLHELGHMIPAKKFGGKVTQYFIGFGPTVWSKQVGETECGIKAIPLGGYVKIVGMLPPGAADLADRAEIDADGNPVHRVRKSNTGLFTQLISDARAAEWELVKPEDTDRLFYKMPWWKKVIVMAGGPSVNIAIAFGIFAGVFATYGNLADRPVDPVVSAVSECALPSTESDRACTPTDPPAPANSMGFELGDRILSFNGVEVSTWPQVQKLIRANDDGKAVIVVDRDGERRTLTGDTLVIARPTSATDDTPIQAGFLGISPSIGDPVTGGVVYTVGRMGHMTVDTVQSLGQLPVKVWGVAKALVGVQERDPEGPMSIVGGGRIAGETAAEEGFPVKEKAIFLLMLIAGFNFFIGMFNFVPLLPLDGGHIAGALWEGLRRAVARVFRRPDPGYVDVAKLLPIAYVMAAAFLVMGVVLIVADVFIPIHLTS
jgi:membrane-associated protease RseP (regulator of RpoE activity)